jgi:hypothetical protein
VTGFAIPDGAAPPQPDDDDLQMVRCPECHCFDTVRVRTSTTQRLEGGRPLALLECACGHSWKIVGTAPVRVLVVRLQRTASQSRAR